MSKIKNIILFLIALQILNIGLFAQDISVLALPQINHINSVTEYIAEVTLGIKDAFPEGHKPQKHDKNSSNTTLHSKVLQFNLFKPNYSLINFEEAQKIVSVYHKCPLPTFYKNFVAEIASPPPKS